MQEIYKTYLSKLVLKNEFIMGLTHSRRAQESFKCLKGTFTPYEYLRLLFMFKSVLNSTT